MIYERLCEGDTVYLDPTEMRDRNRERFRGYNEPVKAEIGVPCSENAGTPDGVWLVRVVPQGYDITVRRGAMTKEKPDV